MVLSFDLAWIWYQLHHMYTSEVTELALSKNVEHLRLDSRLSWKTTVECILYTVSMRFQHIL